MGLAVFLLISSILALGAQASSQGQESALDLISRGMALADSSRYEEAMKSYDEALKLDPGLGAAWSGKGDVLYYQGSYDQALKAYEKALELDSGLAVAWQGKGAVLAAEGAHEEALKCYDRAMELGPPLKGFCLCLKGQSQEALGKSTEAKETFRQALKESDDELKASPDVATCWGTKGATLAALGRHGDALVCYDQALKLNPKDAVVTYYRGLSLMALGKDEESRTALEDAEKLGYRVPS